MSDVGKLIIEAGRPSFDWFCVNPSFYPVHFIYAQWQQNCSELDPIYSFTANGVSAME